MREWVVDRVGELGLSENVHLMDSRPVEDMPRYFASADALLVSLRRAPIFSLTIPSKIQSYLASGRPILASLDGEGARVVKESGAGLVAPAQDAKVLSDIVLKMYQTSEEERESMGRHGREYFERHFEREMLLDRLEQLMA
jgi:glycosyltransferase involved in cell wall biosynthesis